MSAAETVEDQAVIEALDFDHEPQCEAQRHEDLGAGRALFVVHQAWVCEHHDSKDALCCLPCWESAGQRGLLCRTCREHLERDDYWRITRVIGGAA